MVFQISLAHDNDINKSVRDIAAEEVNKIVDGAPAAFDTLREIAAWIVDNPAAPDWTNRVQTLENTVYTPTTGLVDRMTMAESHLTAVQQAIVDLQSNDVIINNQITSLGTRVTNVEDSLKWQNMVLEG